MPSRDERHLAQALAVAASSLHHRWRLGAVLVKSGNIVSAAPNSQRNAPGLMNGINSSFHAEVAALRRLRGGTEGLTVYVARVGKDGSARLARPCSACFSELLSAGVRRIVYTAENGYGVEKVT